MELQLRPYQNEIIQTVFDEEVAGWKRQLVVLPTGAGKTATAISLAKAWRERNTDPSKSRILWLTHRDELVKQTVKAAGIWWKGHPPLGVVKAELDEAYCDFIVASVQTLAVEKRLQNLLDMQNMFGGFGLIISDEHHYSAAPVWKSVLERLGCGQPGGPLMVGLTATPKRADGVGLHTTTDKIVYDKNIIWGIENGFLVPPKGRAVDIDLSKVKMSGKDYALGSLGDALEFENAHHLVAKMLEKYAPERKTIVFTPTVNFAGLVMQELVKLGFKAEMVSGETPSDERQAMYDRLRTGKTNVVVNCMVLVEGFDEPSVDCVVMARPTKSQTLFTQAVGRGLRIFPGKEDCLVIALAGSERNKLVTLASLAGTEYEKELKDAEEEEDEEFDLIGALNKAIRSKAEQFGLKAREIDLIGAVTRKTAWAVINGMFAKRIPKDVDHREPVIVWKQELPDDTWKVCEVTSNAKFQKRSKVLIKGIDMATAQNFATDYIKAKIPPAFIDPNAEWRDARATPRQVEMMKKYKVRFDPKITKGEASTVLDAIFLKGYATAA